MHPQSGHSPPGAALQSSHQSGGVCLYPGILSCIYFQISGQEPLSSNTNPFSLSNN